MAERKLDQSPISRSDFIRVKHPRMPLAATTLTENPYIGNSGFVLITTGIILATIIERRNKNGHK